MAVFSTATDRVSVTSTTYDVELSKLHPVSTGNIYIKHIYTYIYIYIAYH